jgi:hypothetical protein
MQARGVVGNQDILAYAGSQDPCYKNCRVQVCIDPAGALDNSSTAKAAVMPLLDGSGVYTVSLRLVSGDLNLVSVYSNVVSERDE